MFKTENDVIRHVLVGLIAAGWKLDELNDYEYSTKLGATDVDGAMNALDGLEIATISVERDGGAGSMGDTKYAWIQIVYQGDRNGDLAEVISDYDMKLDSVITKLLPLD